MQLVFLLITHTDLWILNMTIRDSNLMLLLEWSLFLVSVDLLNAEKGKYISMRVCLAYHLHAE